MTNHTDLIARLRRPISARQFRAEWQAEHYKALCLEAADALSRPSVTEEMVERGAWVLADAIGEPVYTAETADVVRHILTAALGEPAAGHETYPGHDPAAGLPQPDTAQLRHECAGSGRHEHDGCSCSDAESAILPNGVELAGFQPGVFYNEDLRMTEMLLRDCFAVWHPWGPFKGHTVDVGYDEKGELVGIKIWDDVRNPPAQTEEEAAAIYGNGQPRSPDTAGGAEPFSAEMDAALFGVGFEKVTVGDDGLLQTERIDPRKVYLSAADREAAIRAEATAAERERAELLVLRERDKWHKSSALWGAFDTLAAAIRGGSRD